MRAILQHDERDCGAACLDMIADHYGYSRSLREYRQLTNTDQYGTSVYAIIQAAKKIGFLAEALMGNIEEVLDALKNNEFRVPFIAHIVTEDNYNHFVVVSSINGRNVCVYDPAKGKISESINDFCNKWTGNIVTFQKTGNFKKKKVNIEGLISFLPHMKGQIRRCFGIILMSFFISLIGILGAFAFQLIIDHSSDMIASGELHDHHEHDIEFMTNSELLNVMLERFSNFFGHLTIERIPLIFAGLIVLYVLAAIIQYIRGRLIISMAKDIDYSISLPYFNKIIELPMDSIITRRTGDYLSRYSDISAIREAVSTAAVTLIIDSVMAVGCGIVLYFQSPRLFLISSAVILAYSAVVLFFRSKIKDSNRRYMEMNAQVHSFMKESIDGIETIKSITAEKQIQAAMCKRFGSYIDAAVQKSHIVMIQEALVTGIETIGIAAILWCGFTMVNQGQMTLGALITFYALLGYLITPVKNLIELQPTLQSGNVAAERLNDIICISAENSAGKMDSEPFRVNDWVVSGLEFGYTNQEPLIKNVSFSFHKGDLVALVGKSGCGKTTLAKILVRFFAQKAGLILADDVDLRDYDIKAVRDSIAYVSSTASLYSGTLYDNLRLGNQECSDEWIRKVCDMTGISDLIDESSHGQNFVIEESGINLSSGQRQRIAIARALLKQPALLILDEATSNLDVRTEAEIIRAIKCEMSDTAIIMISHRLSTIRNCDKIVVLNNGTVVGEGSHEELKESSYFYNSLIESND